MVIGDVGGRVASEAWAGRRITVSELSVPSYFFPSANSPYTLDIDLIVIYN